MGFEKKQFKGTQRSGKRQEHILQKMNPGSA